MRENFQSALKCSPQLFKVIISTPSRGTPPLFILFLQGAVSVQPKGIIGFYTSGVSLSNIIPLKLIYGEKFFHPYSFSLRAWLLRVYRNSGKLVFLICAHSVSPPDIYPREKLLKLNLILCSQLDLFICCLIYNFSGR